MMGTCPSVDDPTCGICDSGCQGVRKGKRNICSAANKIVLHDLNLLTISDIFDIVAYMNAVLLFNIERNHELLSLWRACIITWTNLLMTTNVVHRLRKVRDLRVGSCPPLSEVHPE